MITKKTPVLQWIVGLLLLNSSHLWATESDWQIKKQNEQVKVFSRPTASGYIEIKAITTAKAHPKALLALMDDTDSAPKWIAHARQVKILDWFGETERTVHSFFSAPWPVTDRDMVSYSKSQFDADTGTLSIQIQDVGAQHQSLPHYVRMKKVTGSWHVKPQNMDMIEISYQGYGEAGGAIPKWLANKLLISSTFDTFNQLQIWVSKDKYQPKPD